jgi:DNA polymerase
MKVTDSGDLEFYGVDQFTKRWGKIKTHGGKLFENIIQAVARDVFKHGELLVDALPEHHIVLKVHDELVVEVPDSDEFTAHRVAGMMATVPNWAQGLPLAAEGWEDYRYHK